MILTALLLSLVVTAAPQKYDAQIEGPITEESLSDTLTQLKVAYDANKSEALLYINSPGGDALAMLEFMGKAQDLRKYGMKIHCTGDGIVASAASMIFEDICDIRDITPSALVLFHEAAGMIGGKETNMEDGLALIKALDRVVALKVAPRLHLTVEEYRARVKGRDWWMSGEDAYNVWHAADNLVQQKDTPTQLDPPGGKKTEDKDLKLPPPFSPIPSKSNEVGREVPSQDAPEVGSAPWGLGKLGALKAWLLTRDWQKTLMWSVYGLLGLVALGAWVKSALDKRKAKKQWLAMKEAAVRAADEAKRKAIQDALDSIKKKTKKSKK